MLAKIALVIIAVITLSPLYFMASGSMLRFAQIFMMPPQIFPANATFDNYLWAFTRPGIGIWTRNTLIVVSVTALASMLVSVMAGWAFSAYSFHGKKTLWVILLSGLMVPRIALIIPLFVVSHKIGISGTLASVILPSVFSPVGMFLSRHFFDTVPRSLIESARMDGAHETQILRHIIVPVSKPIVTALVLFSALGGLQDWIWQGLQLQTPRAVTLLVGLVRASMTRSIGGNDINPIGHAMTIGVILLAPLLVLFIIANKHFIGSLEGAEKG